MRGERMTKRYRSLSRRRSLDAVLILLLVALFTANTSAYAQAQGQSKPNFCGFGMSACACTEQLIGANDNEELTPPDSDPKKDDGNEYELVPTTSVDINGKNAGSIVFVEGWSKTPDEILNEAVALLNPGQKRMWEHLRTGGASPKWLPWVDLVQFRSSGKLQGPFEYVIASDPTSGKAITSRHMVLKWGPKNCFFRLEEGASKPQFRLDFCISNSWMNGDPRKQLEYYLNTIDPTLLVGAMDFVVAFAPFLGSADLIFNQETIEKARNGQLDAAADLAGSLAGDLFLVAKAAKLSPLYKSNKFVQASAVSLGAASVVFTGGYLWSQSDWGGGDYGQAAFMGVDVAMMLLDRDTRQFITQFSKREFFQRKKPAAAPLTCGPKCDLPNAAGVDIDPKKDTFVVIKEKAECPTCDLDLFPNLREPGERTVNDQLPFNDLKLTASAIEIPHKIPVPFADSIMKELKATYAELVKPKSGRNWSRAEYELDIKQNWTELLDNKFVQSFDPLPPPAAKKKLIPYFHEDPSCKHPSNWRLNLEIGKSTFVGLKPVTGAASTLKGVEWIRKNDYDAIIRKVKQGDASDFELQLLERAHFVPTAGH
jgi:hypothetical protein